MQHIQRSILLLICLMVLFASFVGAQEKQSGDLFIIKVNKKYGFIDKTGKIVIEPQFEYARDFVEGRAIVATRNPDYKLNYIDETGKIIDSTKFDNVKDFSEGLAAVGVGEFTMHGGGNHKFGFIDKTGKLVIETSFREARAFSEGFSAVMNDAGKWGYIDKSGKVVIPFQFGDALNFSEGLACILSDGLFGFVDKSGKFVIPPRFAVPSQFQEGLAAVEIAPKNFKAWTFYGSYGSADGKLVFIDKTGNETFKVADNVKRIGDFSEGLARAEVERKKNDFYTGFIDKTGKIVIKLPFYSSSGKFEESLALIEKNNKFGYIDKTGRIIVEPQYSYAESFRNGLARVETGKQIWDFKSPKTFAYVPTPKSGYIDKTGKFIWQPTN